MVPRCFPGGYNVKLYISRGRLAWWLLAVLHSAWGCKFDISQTTGVVSKRMPQRIVNLIWLLSVFKKSVTLCNIYLLYPLNKARIFFHETKVICIYMNNAHANKK